VVPGTVPPWERGGEDARLANRTIKALVLGAGLGLAGLGLGVWKLVLEEEAGFATAFAATLALSFGPPAALPALTALAGALGQRWRYRQELAGERARLEAGATAPGGQLDRMLALARAQELTAVGVGSGIDRILALRAACGPGLAGGRVAAAIASLHDAAPAQDEIALALVLRALGGLPGQGMASPADALAAIDGIAESRQSRLDASQARRAPLASLARRLNGLLDAAREAVLGEGFLPGAGRRLQVAGFDEGSRHDSASSSGSQEGSVNLSEADEQE
jgi:hypothetical protein